MNKVIRLAMPVILASMMIGLLIYAAESTGWVLASASDDPIIFAGKPSSQQGAEIQANLLVNTLDDELNTDGDCSLREAIEAANTNTSFDACGSGEVLTDTITFDVSGIITVTSQLTVLDGGPLVVEGGDVITTSGGGTTRVWWVETGSDLTISDIVITDGYSTDAGAGLYNYGEITIINSNFQNNINLMGDGGAIYNRGVMTITGSIFLGNYAYYGGGGIQNFSLLTITDSVFTDNLAERNNGGGISSDGSSSLTITNSTFTGNHANFGGGIQSTHLLTISNCIFNNNTALIAGGGLYGGGNSKIDSSNFFSNHADDGGGIYTSFKTEISNSIIDGNSSVTYGGGILAGGIITITGSTITRNTSQNGGGIASDSEILINNTEIKDNTANDGGGIWNDWKMVIVGTVISSNLANADAGGIYNIGTVNLTLSTVAGNSSGLSGGGASNEGSLVIVNSTFSTNTASDGGGISNWASLSIDSSTFYGNSAPDGGTISGTAILTNTIIAGSLLGSDCAGDIIDGGHNLDSDGTCNLDPVNGSLPNTDPLLGPLQDNGGSTLTHALLPGSPAIDAGEGETCQATDQRGVLRPQDGDNDGIAICDMGAYELELNQLIVTTLEDELNNDGDCSLREAIEAANTNTSTDDCGSGEVLTDTITFDVAGIITVTSQLTVMDGGPLVVDGGDAIAITVSDDEVIWYVGSGSDITLQSLTMRDVLGTALGNLSGHVILTDTIFENNTYLNNGNGGVYNDGIMVINNSLFSGNKGEMGGAIYNDTDGTLTVSNCIFNNNVAVVFGGAIENKGYMLIVDSNFSGNRGNFSSTIENDWYSTAEIIHSTFLDNSGNIGVIGNSGTLTVSDSTFSDNFALMGAALGNNGNMVVDGSTFSGNRAVAWGGAIDHRAGSASITNSTFSANRASWGGGAINSVADITIESTTFYENSAPEGGTISGTATLTNTIIAGSLAGGDCFGSVVDGGHNLDSDGTCGFDPANGSLPNTDPLVGPLLDNGGPTLTHALLPASPAIDAGDNSQCSSTDQRAVFRPIDGDVDGLAICDIGSYEFEQGLYLQPASLSSSGVPGVILDYPLQIYNRTLSIDSFNLSLGLHGWDTSLSTYHIGFIDPGASETFTMSVVIPAYADWYDSDSVVVTATSELYPSIYIASSRATTKVYAPPQIQLDPVMLESTQLTDALVTQTLAITNGNGVSLTFNLQESLTQDLMLHMDELAGADRFYDSSGNKRHAFCAVDNCPQAGVPGAKGTALDFDGLEDYLQLPPFELGGPLSISVWVHTRNSLELTGNLIDFNLNFDRLNIMLMAGDDAQAGKLVFYISKPDGSAQYITTDEALPKDQWVHVVAVVDGSGTGYIYWDGVLVKSGPLWTPLIAIRPDQYIGNGFPDLPFFNGMLDELVIYNRALSPDEVWQLYQGGNFGEDIPWLYVEPISGTLPSNSSLPVNVTYNSTNMPEGTYTATLFAINNDPGNSIITIPITLSVVVQVPPASITLTGADMGFVGQTYSFTAMVEPISTTLPITFTWQASDQLPIVHTGGLTDTVTFTWDEVGTQTITVTAMNSVGFQTAITQITIFSAQNSIFMPMMMRSGGSTRALDPQQQDEDFGDSMYAVGTTRFTRLKA